MMMCTLQWIAAGFLLTTLVACQSSSPTGSVDEHARESPHGHGAEVGAADVGVPGAQLAPPPAIAIEHEHLHEQLAAARDAGGETGQAAQAVAEVMAPHFEEEERYAMPPLGLLPALGRGEVSEEMRPAIRMAEQLEANYEQMLAEHERIIEALKQLETAAERDGHADHAAFAGRLILHAQHEEQVLYPTTLLIGEYLRLRLE